MAHPPAGFLAKDYLNLLGTVLGVHQISSHNSHFHDPLLISIDLEAGGQRCSEVGISSLDPRDIDLPSDQTGSKASCIRSQHFRAPVKKFCKKFGLGKPYRFGETQTIPMLELTPLLLSLLTPEDDEGMPRDIIIVGHSVRSDIAMIKKFFDIDVYTLESVKAIIDTTTVSRHVLGLEQNISLRGLLKMLGLDYIGLHNAAHDSRYTLRALLMLFHGHWIATNNDTGMMAATERRISAIERVARLHDPRGPILWCHDSKRVKNSGIANLLDVDLDVEEENAQAGLFELLESPK